MSILNNINKRKLVIETDIGRDPDDIVAISWLLHLGFDVKAICITPGDTDQVAIAKLMCKIVGREDIPIGVSHLNRNNKTSSGGIHYKLLDKFGWAHQKKHDGYGPDILKSVFREHPDCELFVIGPPTNIGSFLEQYSGKISNATIQGGFLGYHLNPFANRLIRLPKFEGLTYCPTFNLNGDKLATQRILEANIGRLQFVCKHVCHTIVYHPSQFKFNPTLPFYQQCLAMLEKDKALHDPAAAFCYAFPDKVDWVRAKMTLSSDKRGWGAIPTPNGDFVIGHLDYKKFFSYLIGDCR